jgi:hypothetical protein
MTTTPTVSQNCSIDRSFYDYWFLKRRHVASPHYKKPFFLKKPFSESPAPAVL